MNIYWTRRHPANTHCGNEPKQKGGKTHNEPISSPQFLSSPALPLSDSRNEEDHDKRPIKETLEHESNEYRGRKPDGHGCWLRSTQGARDEEREEIETGDGVGSVELYLAEGLLQVIYEMGD